MPSSSWAGSWRHNGTGIYADAQAIEDRQAWAAPLSQWSNASPVIWGPRVCVTAEPVEVICVDHSGAPLWQTTHPVRDTLTAPDQQALLQGVIEAERLQAHLPMLLREASKQRRALRRGDADGSATEALARVSAEIVQAQTHLEAHRAYLTPPELGQIGWSTPTPVTTDDAMFVSFGNGIVTRLAPDGTKVWTTWLGPPPRQMKGYTHGVTASPQLLDGTLVVPHAKLTGLDPATGEVRWTGPEYPHYGTPAVARVGTTSVLVTPGGELVRVSDGKVLANDLGAIFYVSPIADGPHVWFVGGTKKADDGAAKLHVTRVALTQRGDTIEATQSWKKALPVPSRLYATPVLHKGQIYVIVDDGILFVVDAESGTLTYERKLPTTGYGHFASPLIAGDQLVVVSSEKGVVTMGLGDASSTLEHLPELRTSSTPSWHDGTWYVRTFDALRAFTPAD